MATPNGYRGWDSLPLPVDATFHERTVGLKSTHGYMFSSVASTEKKALLIAGVGLVAVLGLGFYLMKD